jgi:hypothetical protein
VLGVVVVVLGSANGLFGLGSAVLVVAVAVSSEMQQLVTADQVVVLYSSIPLSSRNYVKEI